MATDDGQAPVLIRRKTLHEKQMFGLVAALPD